MRQESQELELSSFTSYINVHLIVTIFSLYLRLVALQKEFGVNWTSEMVNRYMSMVTADRKMMEAQNQGPALFGFGSATLQIPLLRGQSRPIAIVWQVGELLVKGTAMAQYKAAKNNLAGRFSDMNELTMSIKELAAVRKIQTIFRGKRDRGKAKQIAEKLSRPEEMSEAAKKNAQFRAERGTASTQKLIVIARAQEKASKCKI